MRWINSTLITTLTCAICSAHASSVQPEESLGFVLNEIDPSSFTGLEANVSNQYTDPAQKVQPSELGALSYEDAKRIVLELHQRINDFRVENGKQPLAIHNRINWWTQQHAEWMAAGRYGLGRDGVYDRYGALAQELPLLGGGYEAVASVSGGFSEPAEKAFNQWIYDTATKAQVLRNFNLCGYGLAKHKRSGVWYVTQFFIKSNDVNFVKAAQAAVPNWNPYDLEGQSIGNDADPLHNFPLEEYRQSVLQRFNYIRGDRSVVALNENPLLNKLCQDHADAMASGVSPFGDEGIETRLAAISEQLPNVTRSVEWYAKVPVTEVQPAKEANLQLISSVSRLNEIVNDYDSVGCGIAKSSDGFYYVVLELARTNDSTIQP